MLCQINDSSTTGCWKKLILLNLFLGNRQCSGKKKRTNHCSPIFSLMISKQSCELSRHRNRSNIPSRRVLVICDVRSITNQSIQDCKKWLWNVALGDPVMQAADLEKDCNSFTVCLFVIGVWKITPLWVFFPEQVYCWNTNLSSDLV